MYLRPNCREIYICNCLELPQEGGKTLFSFRYGKGTTKWISSPHLITILWPKYAIKSHQSNPVIVDRTLAWAQKPHRSDFSNYLKIGYTSRTPLSKWANWQIHEWWTTNFEWGQCVSKTSLLTLRPFVPALPGLPVCPCRPYEDKKRALMIGKFDNVCNVKKECILSKISLLRFHINLKLGK